MTNEEALETLLDNAENGYVDIEEVKLVFAEMLINSDEDCKWISVTERLPEEFQRVLVTVVNYNGNKVVRVAEYHEWKRAFQVKENREWWEVGEKGLLAWMPLPRAYEPQESEGK